MLHGLRWQKDDCNVAAGAGGCGLAGAERGAWLRKRPLPLHTQPDMVVPTLGLAELC